MYHIEDLETLLLQKEFEALLEDEKHFVLQHISDQTQYNQLRALLLKMIEESQEDEHWLHYLSKTKKRHPLYLFTNTACFGRSLA
jgi:hypothetical protein